MCTTYCQLVRNYKIFRHINLRLCMIGKFSKKQNNVYISNRVACFKMCSRTYGTFNLRPVVHADGIKHQIILYYTGAT
jgi:hypothetical protein